MNHVATIEADLPSLVDRAAQALAGARSSAEVLQAREMASLAYDVAKRASRLARAKNAHDELIAAAYRAQADALEIESQAKRRLADEYDAAQERGEVASQGKPSREEGYATAADIGLTHKQVHEARLIRDAERAEPGIVRRVLDERIDRGEEPSKSALREQVLLAARMGVRGEGAPRQSNRNPLYVKPTPAGEAWAHLYGDCRAMAEWATDETVALAFQGMRERGDDQSRNVAAIKAWSEVLNRIVERLNAH